MPGTFDLSVPQLHQYQGINPRPADFDAYWAAALAELDATKPDVELQENRELSTDAAECFDLWFTGLGGARVHAKYLRPRRRTGRCPAIVEFHGYTWSSGDWTTKLAYVAEGFCIVSLDCRGQAGLSEDNGTVIGGTVRGHLIRGLEDPDPRKLYYRQVFMDTVRLARILMEQPEVDASRVGTMGWSQGGALAVACAALEPRIKRVVSVYPFLCDYRRVWDLDLAREAYGELRDFFRWRDPRHAREEEFFLRLGYIDIQHLASRVRADVLMLTGLADTICPPSTQFAVYNKITSPKRVELFPDFGHESLPGGSDLIFNHLMALRQPNA
jgi:cephalosporin-C deacetylase